MTIIGILATVIGLILGGIGIVHDFNLDEDKGAMLQPTFFVFMGVILCLAGVSILLYQVFTPRRIDQ